MTPLRLFYSDLKFPPPVMDKDGCIRPRGECHGTAFAALALRPLGGMLTQSAPRFG